ncbi:MAG: type II and III secretion system protein [Candidatus Omnitrophica bacterium]|nr:type II and III secretion system protein [Candidatus Omnitrophota bacterium]
MSRPKVLLRYLCKIPVLGYLFKRDTTDNAKIDLLVFITAHIVKEGEFSPEEIAKFEERMGQGPKKEKARKGKK